MNAEQLEALIDFIKEQASFAADPTCWRSEQIAKQAELRLRELMTPPPTSGEGA